MPDETRLAESEKRLAELEKNSAVTTVRLEQICKEISEIKNNHLVHINNELTGIHSAITSNQTTLLEQITKLRLIDAKAEPTQAIVSDVIKYIIIAIVAAVLTLLLTHAVT